MVETVPPAPPAQVRPQGSVPHKEAVPTAEVSELSAASTFDPTPFAKGVQAWTEAAEEPAPMPGGFEERIANLREVPTSWLGRTIFRAGFGRIKVG